MRYAPPGLCLNDFDLIKLDQKYHMIHLQGPPVHPFDARVLETSYGHGVSGDLVSWTTQSPVFGISDPPGFDDSAIWTMKILEHDHRLWMFYTGLSRENNYLQQIGLAVSPGNDCTDWKRYGNGPILEIDPRYYRTQDEVSWRDPYVIYDPELKKWVMYICARTKQGPEGKQGCVGAALSDNLVDWVVREPVIAPEKYIDMECPVPFFHKGIWYLLVSISDDRKIHAYQGETSLGPFHYSGEVAPAFNYAPRIITAPDGVHVLLHTHFRRLPRREDGHLVRGMLAQPKKLLINQNKIRLGWYDPLLGFFEPCAPGHEGKCALWEIPLSGNYKEGEILFSQVMEGNKGLRLIISPEEILLEYKEDHCRIDYARIDRAPAVSNLKIMIWGEFIEIYCDGILTLSGLNYRHLQGTIQVKVDGKAGDFKSYTLNPLFPGISRDDINGLKG